MLGEEGVPAALSPGEPRDQADGGRSASAASGHRRTAKMSRSARTSFCGDEDDLSEERREAGRLEDGVAVNAIGARSN